MAVVIAYCSSLDTTIIGSLKLLDLSLWSFLEAAGFLQSLLFQIFVEDGLHYVENWVVFHALCLQVP